MDIIKHSNEIGKHGITLHTRVLGILLDEIETAIAENRIRSESTYTWFSAFDFVREVLMLKTEREVWKRLTESDPTIVTFCDYWFFEDKLGRKLKSTPAVTFTGLIYIAYLANCEYSRKLRTASAAHIAADRELSLKLQAAISNEPIAQADKLAKCEDVQLPDNLAGKSQSEIYQLASDYVQIRSQAEATMPTLIDILDALADPAGVPAATEWFTARSWLAANGYKMQLKQQRQFFQAIANCHRFLTIATPQQHKGVNYYSNQHEILLRACATNVLKLGYKRTASFI